MNKNYNYIFPRPECTAGPSAPVQSGLRFSVQSGLIPTSENGRKESVI